MNKLKRRYMLICIICMQTNAIVCKDIHTMIKDMAVGWTLERYSLGFFSHLSLEKCLEECSSTKRCEALNYQPRFRLCELKFRTKLSWSQMKASKGTIYVEIANWRKSRISMCDPSDCLDLQQCRPTKTGHVCINSNCWWKTPIKECSVVDRSQGLSVHSKVTFRCQKGFKLIGRSGITCQFNKRWSEPRFQCIPDAIDCSDLKKQGNTKTGVYQLAQLPCETKSVFCEMDEEGGGWTVLSKRNDSTTNFKRTWEKYKDGFGDPSWNYWIGNDFIHNLTKTRSMDLLYVLKYKGEFQRNRWKIYHVKHMYRNFKVEDEEQNYTMTFDFHPEYSYLTTEMGHLMDMLICDDIVNATTCQDRTPFSTYDSENTRPSECPVRFGGGWWFRVTDEICQGICLNGGYDKALSHYWETHHDFSDRALISSMIMIRPT